jgi:polyhydroxyalkanoate synthesis regulator phasin
VTETPEERIDVQVETTTSEPVDSGSSGLRDVIQRTLLLGVGAAALTVDRAQAVADDFVRRGQLSADEGREMVEDISNRSRNQTRSVMKRLDNSLQGTYRELGLATRQELEDLDFRLRQVEHRLGLLEQRSDATTPENAP